MCVVEGVGDVALDVDRRIVATVETFGHYVGSFGKLNLRRGRESKLGSIPQGRAVPFL
jgi:hypothetical protein